MGGSRKKVLWIDDEIEFLRSHIMFLETRGYGVTPVFSGDDGIQLIRQNPRDFDIVLLDEQMPGKDGLTTLEEIKSLAPDLPVVMVTKSEEEQLMEDALGKKINGYLTKPVNPSQILSVCKSILDSRRIMTSQMTRQFVKDYSQNRMTLAGAMSTNDWIALYGNLTHWDLELEKADDEGLRQSHAGQKSDCNAAFSQFIIENYAMWMKGEGKPPVLSPEVVKRHVAPLLKAGRRVYMVVLDCMRLDQFLAVESLLRKYFEIERHCFFSVIPTSNRYARTSLLSGKFPSDLAREYPGMLEAAETDRAETHRQDVDMLAKNVKSLGISVTGKVQHALVRDAAGAQELINNAARFKSAQLALISVDFVDMLTQGRSTSAILQEIAPDESAFRAVTQSWFQHSPLLQVFGEFSRHDAAIVFTTDHGSVMCSRGTELYGSQNIIPNLRHKSGINVTCDERHSLFISAPERFKLPAEPRGTVYIIAKENYYFTVPDVLKNYQGHHKTMFCYGGISMEEMIAPLAVLTAK